jgi:hypothetical protein
VKRAKRLARLAEKRAAKQLKRARLKAAARRRRLQLESCFNVHRPGSPFCMRVSAHMPCPACGATRGRCEITPIVCQDLNDDIEFCCWCVNLHGKAPGFAMGRKIRSRRRKDLVWRLHVPAHRLNYKFPPQRWCDYGKTLVQEHLDEPSARLCRVFCDSWTGCQCCRRRLQELWIGHLVAQVVRYGAGDAFHITEVGVYAWTAKRRQLARRHAQYARFRISAHAYLVIATEATPGSRQVDMRQAINLAKGTILTIDASHGRPIATSALWTLPQNRKAPTHRTIGEAKNPTINRLREIFEFCGLPANEDGLRFTRVAMRAGSKVQSVLPIQYPATWTKAQREHLLDCCHEGELKIPPHVWDELDAKDTAQRQDGGGILGPPDDLASYW